MSYEKERAITEAATPGPWDEDGMCVRDADRVPVLIGFAADPSSATVTANRIFAAMANPQFVLGLMDRVERYERAIQKVYRARVYENGHMSEGISVELLAAMSEAAAIAGVGR